MARRLLPSRVLALTVALTVGATSWAPPARAAGETLDVVVSQVDGTAPFTATSAPPAAGLDSSATDRYVRTNDSLTYNVEINANGGSASNATFTIALPRGTALESVPPYCRAGSSLTPASVPAPVVPVTATSWTSLPSQTLVCNVGTLNAGETKTYPVTSTVRPEVPNGAPLGSAASPVTASVRSDAVTTPVISDDPVYATVSARPQFDVSKNGVSETENTGIVGGGGTQQCSPTDTRTCFVYNFPMTISSPAGGKGTAPLTPTFTFSDDLSPAALFGAAAVNDPDFLAAGPGALAKYGAILRSCGPANQQQPYSKIGAGQDAAHSVRDSGTTTCTQPGGPGTPVSVSVANADTTALTSPRYVSSPADQTIPIDRAYVYSTLITIVVPVDAVRDLGVRSGATTTLQMDNKLTDFAPTGVDGTANVPSAQRTFNDHRSFSARLASSGNIDKFFTGVPGTPGNVPAATFYPAIREWEGPTGSSGPQGGDGQLFPDGTTISTIRIANGSTSGATNTYLICDAWDSTKLRLADVNAPAGSTKMQAFPSNGQLVWFSGGTPSGMAAPANETELRASMQNVKIQYGTGPASAAGATCGDGASPAGWFDSAAAVPGNDPALLAQGVYSAVTRVRVNASVPPGSYALAIGLRAAKGLPVGTVLPNWANVKLGLDVTADLATMAAGPISWQASSYDPGTSISNGNTGNQGDRLIVGGAVVRVVKEVRDPAAGTWTSSSTPAYTGGQEAQFRLRVSNTGGASGSRVPVVVEDCLPVGESFVSSSVTPAVVRVLGAQPAGSDLTCTAGQTYVRWDLGDRVVNATIDPITYVVRAAASAPAGTYTNTARVSSPADPSLSSLRTATAAIRVVQPSGLALDKTPLTPVVEVNRAGETNPAELVWRVDLRLTSNTSLKNPDVIDVLPQGGLNGTTTVGAVTFVAATVTSGAIAGQPITLLYTKAPTVAHDPLDPTNLASGSTVWCSAPAGGQVVLGAGTSAACPSSPAEVTGVRVQRAGDFRTNESLSFEVRMVPTNNAAGDVYVNRAAARVTGQALPVGPLDAAERVIGGEIGDRVWSDLDADGVQDTDEPGLGGVAVRLTGTDTDGNQVAASTTSAADGSYRFTNLPSGTYTVTFDPASLQPGQSFTQRDQGGDDAADSDGDPTTGQAAPVVLGPGQSILTVDQGVATQGLTLVKQVCRVGTGCDPAAEADWVATTTVLAGSDVQWRLKVRNPGPAPLTDVRLSDPAVASCSATRPALAVGEVWTTVCTAALTASLTPNTATATATAATGPVTATATASAQVGTGSLGDRVWYDADGDGILDPGELGIGGATVTLTYAGDPVDPRDDRTLTTVTAADGSYGFQGLPAGAYTVAVSQLDPALRPTHDLDGSGTASSTVVTLAEQQRRTDVDFGYTVSFQLGDRVWLDRDGDGVLDPGEPPVPDGTVVELWDAITGAPTGRTTTTTGGTYLFEGLPAGRYLVVLPTTTLTGPLAGAVAAPGGADAADGNQDEAQGHDAVAGPGGSIRSGVITLSATLGATPGDQISGDEPSGDGFANRSLDLALLAAPALGVAKEVCAAGSCAPDAALGAGGWAETASVPFLADVTFRVVVTNTGGQDLRGVIVGDTAAPACAQTVGDLPVGATRTLTCVAAAVTSGFTNTVLVSATGVGGATVTAADTASVTTPVGSAGLRLTKVVVTGGATSDANTAPGVLLGQGRTAFFSYQVTVADGSPVPVSAVAMTDDNGTPGDPSDDLTPSYASGDTDGDNRLDPGETWVFVSPTVSFARRGQYTNTATVTGEPVNAPGTTLRASDVANVFVAAPAVEVVKTTNGRDVADGSGPALVVGDPVTWTYRVRNTGNVALASVRIVDDRGVQVGCGPADADGDGAVDLLAPGASVDCTGSGTVAPGPYVNVAQVSGTPADASGRPLVDGYGDQLAAVPASDSSRYTGVQPGVTVVKRTQGSDNPQAPGPEVPVGAPVRWTYTVTNTGTTALTGVSVVDDKVADVSCGVAGNPIRVLVPGQAVECDARGVAVEGPYENTATVSGTAAIPLPGDVPATWPSDPAAYAALTRADGTPLPAVTASDTDHYLGVAPRPTPTPTPTPTPLPSQTAAPTATATPPGPGSAPPAPGQRPGVPLAQTGAAGSLPVVGLGGLLLLAAGVMLVARARHRSSD